VYEVRFGSGLNPNGSGACLLGRILANGLVERVRTWRLDRSAAAGALGLSWAGYWAAWPAAGPPRGRAGWAKPVGSLSFGPLGLGI
jgi:hypothetical protein